MIRKVAAVVILVGLCAVVAFAQFAKPEDAIKYRKAQMVLIVHHFGAMGAVVKGKAPYDAAGFAANAATVEMLAGLGWKAFLTPGSDKGNTGLKAAALKNPGKFTAAGEAFQAATAKLVRAADSGDLSEIKPQFGAVAQTCGGCHKPFRK